MIKTFFPSIKKENKTMANSTQYVVYTRNFKSRAKQIGVFAEPASAYKVNGEVHGGKIKFKNLAVKGTARKTATNKMLSKGIDFTVKSKPLDNNLLVAVFLAVDFTARFLNLILPP